MNIVYVSREWGPATGGGIGTYIDNACKAMAAAGNRVFLLSDCLPDGRHEGLPQGVEYVGTHPLEPDMSGGFFSPNQAYAWRVYQTLLALSSKHDLDVVEFPDYRAEGFYCIRAKRVLNAFAGSRVIVKCHTPLSLLESINEETQFYAEVQCDIEMEDYCVRHADMVTSPSQSLADYFQERVGRKDIRNCPYPLHLTFLDGPKPWQEIDPKKIRFLGSVQVRKGVDVFIDAAVRILEQDPEYQFEIYGQERNATVFGRSYTEHLRKRIPECWRDSIHFMGAVPYEKIGDLMRLSGVVVLPSRWENWANACLESMAMGCVVLASERGGMAEMIQDGRSGFHIDPLDPEALSDTIIRVSLDGDLLDLVSRKAVERARQLADPEKATAGMMRNYAHARELPHSWQPGRRPLVSVIVPYYNQADTVAETIASIRASDYPAIEIVVVNDGSTSPSARLRFEQLEGVVKVDKPNGGLSSARNAGIAVAEGEYVIPIDADDRMHPDYIRLAVDALESCPELGYVTCHARNFGAFDSVYAPVGFVSCLMPFLNTSGKCVNLFRKDVIGRVGGYDETLVSYEDWDLLLSLNDHGIEGDVIPLEMFEYRRSFGSMVYAVANPLRASLIQYMMSKHREGWKAHAPLMAQILVRLWKDAEIREENLREDRFVVYFAKDGAFSESRSARQAYSGGGRRLLEFLLPFDPSIDSLRLDPCDREKRMTLLRVDVRDAMTGQVLMCAGNGSGFDAVQAAGTTKLEAVGPDQLRFESCGNDPQFLIRCPSFEGKELKLQVEFEV